MKRGEASITITKAEHPSLNLGSNNVEPAKLEFMRNLALVLWIKVVVSIRLRGVEWWKMEHVCEHTHTNTLP